MTESISASLAEIERVLRRLDRQVLLRLLRPGISSGEVRAALKKARLSSSSEVEDFYGWHDGLESGGTIGDISLFPGFYPLSLEGALKNYRAFVSDSRWEAGWLPILADGGGDFYIVDLRSESETPIRRFRIDEAEHPIEYFSLADMLSTLARAFGQGIIFLDDDGYLEMDDLAFAALAAELNPRVEWWTS